MREGLNQAIERHSVHAHCSVFGSVWSLYFMDHAPRNYRDIARSPSGREHPLLCAYRETLRRYGIYVHPYFAVRGYISAAHSEDDIERTIIATDAFFQEYRGKLR